MARVAELVAAARPLVTDLAAILALTFLAYSRIVEGAVVTGLLGAVLGAGAVARAARKNGGPPPASAVGALLVAVLPPWR